MDRIIFRLKRNDMIGHNTYFNYDENMPYYEQKLELSRSGYINDHQYLRNNSYLHFYYSSLYVYEMGYMETTINVPFNYANKYYFYIDYFYYRKVMNELNYIIFINKKYLIDVSYFKVTNEETFPSVKEGDPRYNKVTHKSFLVETDFAYDYEKYTSSIK